MDSREHVGRSDPPLLHRAAALTLLVLTIGLFATVVMIPALRWFSESGEERGMLAQRVAHLKANHPDLDALSKALQDLSGKGVDTVHLLTGSSGSELETSLQSRVREVISGSGGRLDRIQTTPPSPVSDSFVRVEARFVASLPEAEIMEFVTAAEVGQPILFFQRLKLAGGGPGERGNSSSAAATVEVEGNIYGFAFRNFADPGADR